MGTWEDYAKLGQVLEWPYPLKYEQEQEVTADVLVLGGGIAGCWAAISAAKTGARVVLAEKGATIRSGSGGSGVDHWASAAQNPCSKIGPEELTNISIEARNGFENGITQYINCRDSYDTLLELEKMGGKIRDTIDEFKGADFRDEKTKLLFAFDYVNKTVIRVWGANFKPILYKQCKSMGVGIHDRIMITSLLNEGGKSGARITGATGINTRTGEFVIFRSKAVVLCMSYPSRNWTFSSELRGLSSKVINNVGSGHAIAWKAGALFTNMERSQRGVNESGYCYPPNGTGNSANTWFACSIVDAKGKEVPWVDRDGRILKTVSERYTPAQGQKAIMMVPGVSPAGYLYGMPKLIPDLAKRIHKGEFELPLYADLTSMPEHERKAIWGLMVGNEARTKIPVFQTYTEAGFDPEQDMLQSYYMLRGEMFREFALPQQRVMFSNVGGVVVDWELKTNIEGLYAAGEQVFSCHGHSGAATSGRYAGRMAAYYSKQAKHALANRDQIKKEKQRVYAPVKRDDGLDWKELNAGLCRVMQNYCGEPKSEELLKLGLLWLQDIEENELPVAYAENPHKLARTLEVMDILTCDRMILHACLARKASSESLSFLRSDYPQMDPPEWHKWITIKQNEGKVEVGDLPIDYWDSFEENYVKHDSLG